MAHGESTRKARGFTLIEILIVLALIALLTGLATLSAGAVGSPVTREARRLAATLQLAVDESRLQGRVLGLRFDAEGYSYLELVDAESEDSPGFDFVWQSFSRRGAMAPRSWPAPLEFQLRINGRLVAPVPRGRRAAPQIVLLPEGEFTPFSLRLIGTREAGTLVRFSSAGRFEIRTP